jgi:hypothetical protein
MSSISAQQGGVTFTPKSDGSYFYESFHCQQAVTDGYGGMQFTLQGPTGGSVGLELQTTASCNDTANYTSSYNVISGLTGSRQTITLPFTGFDNNPNYDSIIGFSWAEFSPTASSGWSIGNITLVCGSVAVPTTTATPTGMAHYSNLYQEKIIADTSQARRQRRLSRIPRQHSRRQRLRRRPLAPIC